MAGSLQCSYRALIGSQNLSEQRFSSATAISTCILDSKLLSMQALIWTQLSWCCRRGLNLNDNEAIWFLQSRSQVLLTLSAPCIKLKAGMVKNESHGMWNVHPLHFCEKCVHRLSFGTASSMNHYKKKIFDKMLFFVTCDWNQLPIVLLDLFRNG